MTSQKQTTRQKAAAARAAAEASERRRENAMRIGIGAVVVIIVAGIIGAALWTTRAKPVEANNTALPTGVSAPAYAAPAGTATTPVLDMYEDFQCPACAATEAKLGPTITAMVNGGQLRANYHPMNFLDKNLGNNSSTQAAAAFGCAVDAGRTLEYHNVVFANQPTKEGTGYTLDQLKQFGVQAGIVEPALTTFNTCVDTQKYAGWPVVVTEEANQRGVQGTPAFFLNGTELQSADYATPEALQAKIAAATGQ